MPKRMFEDMGFLYLSPIDGHDIGELTRMFRRTKELQVPVIIHCVTQSQRLCVFRAQPGEVPRRRAVFHRHGRHRGRTQKEQLQRVWRRDGHA